MEKLMTSANGVIKIINPEQYYQYTSYINCYGTFKWDFRKVHLK
jgi:hypothetical protein